MEAERHPLRVFPDEAVVGPDWGKLMRRLAMQTGREIRVLDPPAEAHGPSDILLIGSATLNGDTHPQGRIILVAPSINNSPVD